MKTISILFAMFLAHTLNAQSEKSLNIEVIVENISSADGSVLFGLYTEDTFMKAKPNYSAKSEILDGVAQITFENIPEGTYAISCFHDANGNNKMDFEPTGIPKEAYGISNNKVNLYGPPIWSDAKFDTEGNEMKMNIKLTR
ncbi:DUF2141 domain-containing protein [Gillisia sp. M10.2A]|uniref:DUF2141 domain-containing protein n=1 Tax=Gillisia lutea TaxID=2909668 RepID=A0ABS9EG27_9FLAO|nr:DUF2141 domain-containing protein [Gillisia lutea]MCF4101843.1 DUF2141 domain-containing protein [Gillisia lutea]